MPIWVRLAKTLFSSQSLSGISIVSGGGMASSAHFSIVWHRSAIMLALKFTTN